MNRRGPWSTERFAEIDALFQAVLEVSEAERECLLAAHADDPELVREVQALLDFDGEEAVLEPFGAERLARILLPEESDEIGGERLGAYRLVRRLGSGGMGEVWLGERADGAFEQRVALKILPPTVFSESSIRRFERERQILAHLSHANIARLLDGGVDHRGRPFLAMELVEGRPIGEYCDDQRLSVEDRLRLVIAAARAVQAAHRNLIVHCDLKPANLLVTDDGVVKLLDFGIAELVRPGEVQEITGQIRRLTPEYASPESLTGDTITTASDVYQLGLLTFELVCGRRARREASLQELTRVAALELSVQAPSTALVEGDGPSAAEIAAARRTTAPRLRRRLAGDLDAIVLQALAPDPEDRYPSAEDFALDLERFLESRAVQARRLGRVPQAWRLVRRHPAISALAALLLLAAGGLVQQNRIVRQERDRAETEAKASRATAEKSQAVADFLVSILTDASLADLRDELTVVELLDRGTLRTRAELDEDAPERAVLEEILGRVYLDLGRVEDSLALLADAVSRKRKSANAEELSDSILNLATVHVSLGRHDEARRLLQEALELQRDDAGVGAVTRKRARTLSLMSYVLGMLGELEPMLALRKESLSIRVALGGGSDPDTAQGLNDLCFAYNDVGDYARALEHCSRALEIWRAHDLTSQAMGTLKNLALVELGLGRLEEAQRHLQEAMDWVLATHPAVHPRSYGMLLAAGQIAAARGELGAAGAAFRRAREITLQVEPSDHRNLAWLDVLEARLLIRTGVLAEAEQQARGAVERLLRTHGENQHLVLRGRIVLAESMIALGRVERAEAELAEVEERLRVGRSDQEMWLERCRELLAGLRGAPAG